MTSLTQEQIDKWMPMLRPAVPFDPDRMALAVVGPMSRWTVGDVKGIDLEYYGAGALCDGMGV